MSAEDADLPLVLVADDKRNMVRLMAKVLRGDARVRTAGDGSEALRIVESEPVEVVLSDLLRVMTHGDLRTTRRSQRSTSRSTALLLPR